MLAMQQAPKDSAVAYAAQLAKAIGVPLQLAQPESTAQLAGTGWLPALPYPPPPWPAPPAHERPGGYPLSQTLATMVAAHDALLLLLARPTSRKATPHWLTQLALMLLRHTTQPVLMVPAQAPSRVPLRIALATDGEPFRLGAERRLLHTLLFTLPIQLTVVHVQRPELALSEADVLQSVQACGLATRCVATHLAMVASSSPAAGILLGAQQTQADLLVLIVRPRSLQRPHFAQGVTATLLQQSPVPLLVLAAEA